jgi:hypothetical protein
MNDMTDTTEGSEVSRDGCDSPPRASPQRLCWDTGDMCESAEKTVKRQEAYADCTHHWG